MKSQVQKYESALADEIFEFMGAGGRYTKYTGLGGKYMGLRRAAKKYKFFIAMENSRCRHYITEKFIGNALAAGAVPIVMGAPREDYEKLAPGDSFIEAIVNAHNR